MKASKINPAEKIVLLGASRGLGQAVARRLQEMNVEVTCFSRSSLEAMDFSKEAEWPNFIDRLAKLNPDRLFYFAGGGPHGEYFKKEWKDHLWSLRVNFLFPAFLLSQIAEFSSLKQVVFVGSAIAESEPDPQAASYAAGKAALKNLLLSIHVEQKSPQLDLRLFSPGYMDTGLLPANAWPRRQPGLVKAPAAVADAFLEWVQTSDDTQRHFVLR